MTKHVLIAAFGLAGFAACGGGGSSPTTPTGTQTETFTGTSSVNAAGVCTGAIRHLFAAGEGTVVVALAQVTGATSVVVQVCPQNKVGDSLCSIQPWARLATNETVRAPLQGGRDQEINVYSGNCFTTGATATTATYTVTVEHPR